MPYTIEAVQSGKIAGGGQAQNASQTFSVSLPSYFQTAGINKIIIHSVTASAELSTTGVMAFDLLFFGTDTYSDTGTDVLLEDYLGEIDFATTDAEQLTGGATFRYSLGLQASNRAFPLHYVDMDNTGEIHCELVLRSATAFNAADSIEFTFMVEPIL